MPARLPAYSGRRTLHPVFWLVLLAALLTVLVWGIYRYRHRFVRSNVDVLRLLPATDATTFYADLARLRSSGYLQLLAAQSTDPEYRAFLKETNFDFTRDLDAVAGAALADRLVLIVKGRFDWNRTRSYVMHHQGHCSRRTCALPASRPGQWLSLTDVQPDVLALAIAPFPEASAQLARAPEHAAVAVSPDPVWLRPAAALIQKPNAPPSGLRMFAIALQSASSVTVSLGSSTQAAFDLKLTARFGHPTIADTARNQLVIDTNFLKLELAREHAPLNPADLTGLLTAGHFWTQGAALHGAWPVRKELLDSLR